MILSKEKCYSNKKEQTRAICNTDASYKLNVNRDRMLKNVRDIQFI